MNMEMLGKLTEAQLRALPPEQISALLWLARWRATARPKQLPPVGDWSEWGLLAGRGFGKLGCKNIDVPTPIGWRKLGDLTVGDQVFDEHG
ncbi:MAG TPA: hypothetical protein PLB78_16930, partial [Anaerolineae bacterium]|nr:hypothetical protein [Anaerolineae bacterium]